jgi:hypothetical protein
VYAHETHAHEVIAEEPEMKSVIEDIIKEVASGSEVDPRVIPRIAPIAVDITQQGYMSPHVPNIDQSGCGRDILKSGDDTLASKALRPKCANQRVGGFSLGPPHAPQISIT